MIVAVGLHDRIGVGIEEWSERTDCGCFAEVVRCFWNGLPEDRKDTFFYRRWTRKERFVKVVGVGIGLDVFRVVSSSGRCGAVFVRAGGVRYG